LSLIKRCCHAGNAHFLGAAEYAIQRPKKLQALCALPLVDTAYAQITTHEVEVSGLLRSLEIPHQGKGHPGVSHGQASHREVRSGRRGADSSLCPTAGSFSVSLSCLKSAPESVIEEGGIDRPFIVIEPIVAEVDIAFMLDDKHVCAGCPRSRRPYAAEHSLNLTVDPNRRR
jgi:hypothetical protein